MTIIAISNQKGGVGKTTTTTNLAHALLKTNKDIKILLLDLDHQGNLGTSLGVDYQNRAKNLYTFLCGQYSIVEIKNNFILKTYIPRLDILPSNMDLAAFNTEVANIPGKEFILINKITPMQNMYDYILIDCSPTLNILNINALVAADHVLVPMQCEYLSLEGLVQLMYIINLVQKNLNPDLNFLGVVLTMFDSRNNLTHSVVNEVKEYLKDKVFDALIPRSIKISESQSYGQTILTYDPKSIVANAYQKLARELINKLNNLII